MSTPNLTVNRIVRRALSYARLDMPAISEAVGKSRAALHSYYTGKRRIPPATRERLADFLEAHANIITDCADDLRATTPAE